MFIVTAKVNALRRALLFAILFFAAVILILHHCGSRTDDSLPQAATNEDRLEYLTSLGWEVDPEPLEALRLTLPESMEEPYRSYNELQRKQGLDLTPVLGETLERFAYRVRNYPNRPEGCQIDLYVYHGSVVAGDVLCAGVGGFIDTLTFPR